MPLLGVDIERIARIKKVMQKTPGFIKKVFTPSERAYCASRGSPAQHYTARLCAKEALCKALGIPLAWQDLDVQNEDSGRPVIHVRGQTAKTLAGRAIRLSLAHAGDYAIATVLIEDNQAG